MKTKLLFLAAMATFALTSCVNDEFIGDPAASELGASDGSINFGFALPNATRAGDLVGSAAATKLQNQFVVYGTKHATDEQADASKDEVVFQNYVVQYVANTAGHTQTNTNNWEYVSTGENPITTYPETTVSPAISGTQAPKYWDYSTSTTSGVNGYTFYAFASKADLQTTPKVTVAKLTTGTTLYDKGYTITIKKDATLDNLYISDRTPVDEADYGKPVTLKFRNFGTRVRVGFYETIPGYKVQINKFYVDGDASAVVTAFSDMDVANTTNFAAALQAIKLPSELTAEQSNVLTVTYNNASVAAIENQPKVTSTTPQYKYSLVLGTGVVGTDLATSSATPTWDNTDGAYTTVFPFIETTKPMLVKVDYTLTAEDGSAETIEVKGANVVVPTQYVQWKPNFAYTYIFKIAPNTNGSTDDGTHTGLYPITFDAAVVAIEDDKTQETITTVADYSVTTYTNGSKVTVDNEYKKNKDIYVVMTDNSTGNVVAPTAIGDDANNKAQIYRATTTGDAINEATVFANLTGSPNGITLTATTGDEVATLQQYVPAADGTNFDFGANGAVKFKGTDDGTFVYVKIIRKYVAPTYTAVGEAIYSGSTTYYFKTTAPDNVYYPAAGINAENFEANKANLYTKTADGTPGVYAIKVIKVVD